MSSYLRNPFSEKKQASETEIVEITDESDSITDHLSDKHLNDRFNYKTKRLLKPRHIHLIAIGGSIGTGLFVTIGSGLTKAGPAGLFMAFTIYSIIVLLVALSIGEIICYLPIDSPFISFAGRLVDPAFEVVAGYNFYIMVSLYIPFEITAVNGMIHFWRSDYSPAAAFVPQMVVYLALNIFAVKWYGESEFILSIGKLILAISLFIFTFVVMVGGNPQHDAFGFRYWNDPGAFAEYITDGTLGHFQGFLAALFNSCFVIVAPEYIGMVAGECVNPREVLPVAFKTVVWRLIFFFIGGALSVGILVAYNDPSLVAAIANGAAGANVSPYVIAMKNLKINVLPHIVNVLCISSAFSAGNSYMYCSTRALYGLAKKGLAPKIFTWVTKSGVPIGALAMASAFSCLSLLQLGSTAKTALTWMINLTTSCQVTNYIYMSITHLCFYRACKVQGIDRSQMPLYTIVSKFQPYVSIFTLIMTTVIVGIMGYTGFLPSLGFDYETFLDYYLMVFINIAIFFGYKLIYRTKFVRPEDADLTTGLAEIEEHEAEYYKTLSEKQEEHSKKYPKWLKGFMDWLL
ncbi:unnamed protein product [[Candida] boidinii]|nr:hypothetical protein BVG19_g3985 [[Candida] boidinii]OWB52844.1 hypothetical protein B5S27_g4427 [[Candida] boidinii]GME99934.1 unnamed protein product [[Candida] boidinii]